MQALPSRASNAEAAHNASGLTIFPDTIPSFHRSAQEALTPAAFHQPYLKQGSCSTSLSSLHPFRSKPDTQSQMKVSPHVHKAPCT